MCKIFTCSAQFKWYHRFHVVSVFRCELCRCKMKKGFHYIATITYVICISRTATSRYALVFFTKRIKSVHNIAVYITIVAHCLNNNILQGTSILLILHLAINNTKRAKFIMRWCVDTHLSYKKLQRVWQRTSY